MRTRVRAAVLAGCALALLAVPAGARAVSLQPVGTFSTPIQIAAPPGDPRLFVVERGGTIQVLSGGVKTQFLDIHTLTTTDGERGLESMAFDPNYASNGLFYVFYTGDGVDAGGALGDIHIDEFQVSSTPNVADAASRRTVWTFPHGASNHNGGQLQFGKDGLLYITVGDNANSANAQTAANPYGKVLRIDPHGATEGAHGIPPTNPFAGNGTATQEVWSLGLRNPFRFSFDHATGDLVVADVGSGGTIAREEINLAPTSAGLGRGVNFGWPCREGFGTGPVTCTGSFTDPVFAYPHPDPGGDSAWGCAIIGGFVYRGAQMPEVAGRYFYSDNCNGELRSAQLGLPLASGDRSEGPVLSGPQSFGEDANCELYVTNGNVVSKIVGSGSASTPSSCQAAPAQAGPSTTAKSCKRPKKKRGTRAAARGKKRTKLCLSGSFLSRP